MVSAHARILSSEKSPELFILYAVYASVCWGGVLLGKGQLAWYRDCLPWFRTSSDVRGVRENFSAAAGMSEGLDRVVSSVAC